MLGCFLQYCQYLKCIFWNHCKFFFFLGWTGHISTSWKITSVVGQQDNTTTKQKLYDGSTHVLYWADALSEIAFVIPSQFKSSSSTDKRSFDTSSLPSKHYLVFYFIFCACSHQKVEWSTDFFKYINFFETKLLITGYDGMEVTEKNRYVIKKV